MNFQNLTIQSEVRNFATLNPQIAIKTFKKLNIDFCCRGTKPLNVVCSEKGLDPNEVLNQLNRSSSNETFSNQKNWNSLSSQELIENILVNHHQKMKDLLPELTQMMTKVLKAHGQKHPELHDLSKELKALRDELEPHLMKEEAILFPMIQNLENDGFAAKKALKNMHIPIKVMTEQHEDLGNLLRGIRKLTGNFSIPDDACNTLTYLYKKLEALENDLLIHTHKENNILFSKVLIRQKIATQIS